ncbi:O-antigen ligase [Scopulibacillus darangshiensis]|uniref:O-antigen ligase n=1 Tax=Scopulibacillus darangshiensis TaxID=442528 RepID=A0A4R2NTX5_9BACL|nr:O-antigen ligase family protein [Scopulibacillus darangshiensis]TCP24918.1 O-antigen ligase [Scopulibacillus darangshiensis]
MILEKNNILSLLLALFVSISIGVLSVYGTMDFFIIGISLFISVLFFVFTVVKRNKMLSLFSQFLILSLILIPGISLSGIGFRLDDFIVIFLTLGLIFTFVYGRKRALNAPPIIKWVFAYLIYSLFISLVRVVFDHLQSIYLLFFIKEIQYFIYFIAFYYLARNKEGFSSKVRKTFFIASLITILWGLFQLVTGNIRGYYGIGIISVQNPSQSGVVFFIITIFLMYMSSTAEKRSHSLFLSVGSCISAILTVATISRTATLVLIVTFLLYLFISLCRKKWNYKKIFIAIYLSSAIIPLGYKLFATLGTSIFDRFSRIEEGTDTRLNHWGNYLSHSDTIGYIFGNGKGFMQVIVGSFTLQADNQYVRLLVEVGVVGLILWIILIGSIILFCFVNFKRNYTDALFLLLFTFGFIIFGMTQEAYLVAIQGSLYWILTGFFIGKMLRQNDLRNNQVKTKWDQDV